MDGCGQGGAADCAGIAWAGPTAALMLNAAAMCRRWPRLQLQQLSLLLVCLNFLECQDGHHTLAPDAELLSKSRNGPPGKGSRIGREGRRYSVGALLASTHVSINQC
jgi:hypothetical protein